jgi:hypothetical protein
MSSLCRMQSEPGLRKGFGEDVGPDFFGFPFLDVEPAFLNLVVEMVPFD